MHFRAVFEPDPLPSIVISEIHYNPSEMIQGADELYEFIELVNIEERSIDLSGYRFSDGIYITFPTDTYIKPGECIILACDTKTYLNHGFQVFQFTDGRLSNSGETICLVNNLGECIDRVTYSDYFPWPLLPDGNGPSLELRDLKLDNSIYSSWKPSEIDGGTPGWSSLRTSVSNSPVPDEFIFSSSWPNPFSESVTFSFSLLTRRTIEISIFNLIDGKVCFQDKTTKNPGSYNFTWTPVSVNPGAYAITFTTEDYSYCTKLIYLGEN